MTRIAYVNGRYLPQAEAGVHVEDRGFLFADAVYEVCEVRRAPSSRRRATWPGWSGRSPNWASRAR